MRPIDADELLTAFPVDDEPTLTKSCVRMTIQHMPTVDAVPVVRCKDCKWCDMGECEHKFGLLVANDENYCSYGVRKDGDEHG